LHIAAILISDTFAANLAAMPKIEVIKAAPEHKRYAADISEMIDRASADKDSGLAKRSASYLEQKIEAGTSVIAFVDGAPAGFCYVETWGHGKYVANSGLIVAPRYRGLGLAKKIKQEAFQLSRKLFPQAKLFGLTTSLAVMKINSSLGYKPVTFSELTHDEAFWKGCQTCLHYDILQRTQRKSCLCTGMLYDPQNSHPENTRAGKDLSIFKRWFRLKRYILGTDNK
jgi:GNAT superfamily N-acetyltransferase